MSMRDEDLFLNSTQSQEDDTDKDDVYLVLAKAITERKCKIDQKIEKLKLIISEEKELNEELKSKIKSRKCEKKEIKEVVNQKRLRVMTIKNTKESQITVERTLDELSTKIALKKEEVKKKSNEYQSIIKDIHGTWASFKEQYENFPIARQVKEIMTDKRKLEIEYKNMKMDISDVQRKQKMKNDIAEKKFFGSVVKLAQLYFSLQRQIMEHNVLQEKTKQLNCQLTDNKSSENISLPVRDPQAETGLFSSKDQRLVQSPSKFLDFKIPDLPVPSLSSDNVEESSGMNQSFSWGSLLSSISKFGFSAGLLNRTEKKSNITSTDIHKLSPEYCEGVMNGGKNSSSYPQSNKISNDFSNSGRKVEKKSVLKRSLEVGYKNKENEEDKNLNKKVDNKPLFEQITQRSGSTSLKTKELQQEMSLQNQFSSQEREKTKANSLYDNNKESMLPWSSEIPAEVKPITSSLSGISSNSLKTSSSISVSVTQNLLNTTKQLESQANTNEPQVSQKQITTLPTNFTSNFFTSQWDYDSKGGSCKIVDNNTHKKQPQSITVEREPLSPVPDIIPVENSGQSASQGSIEPGELDYTCSSEIDESAKVAYQKMADESPMHSYASGPYWNTQNSKLETDGVVHSHYFEEDSTDNPGKYQASPPFSPVAFDDDSQAANGILSPPPKNISAPERNTSSASSDDNPSNQSFNFSFMPGSTTKKSSVFNLF